MTTTRGRPALQPAGVFILYSTTLPADESGDQQVRFRWADGPISHTYSQTASVDSGLGYHARPSGLACNLAQLELGKLGD